MEYLFQGLAVGLRHPPVFDGEYALEDARHPDDFHDAAGEQAIVVGVQVELEASRQHPQQLDDAVIPHDMLLGGYSPGKTAMKFGQVTSQFNTRLAEGGIRPRSGGQCLSGFPN